MSPSAASSSRETRWAIVFALVLFGWNLWATDLRAPDEPYFGEGAREMIADGEWLVPHVNGKVTTDKPPLFFWLIAIFSLPPGTVTSFTARLPSALAALGSVILIMRLGRRMAGPRVGVAAGVILASTYMFWEKARSAQIDALLCFLILIALSAFEGFRAGDLGGRRAGIVFWAASCAAVLAKGPVGLLLPLGVALLTLVFDRRLSRWRDFAPFTGPLTFLAIAGVWVIAVTLEADDYSVWGALQEHFVDRGLYGMHHKQPPWYYLRVIPYALFPWSFLVPGALLLAWRRRRCADDRFLLVYALFVVVFFSISTEKRDLYILPAVPIFALLSARLTSAIVGWWKVADDAVEIPGQRWVTVPLAIIGALMLVVGIAAPIVVGRAQDDRTQAAVGFVFWKLKNVSDSMQAYEAGTSETAAAILAVVMTAGGALILLAAARGRTLAAAQRTAATMAVALLVLVTFLYPALEPTKSGRELALAVRDASAESRAAGRKVLALGVGNVSRSVSFYSEGLYMEERATAEEALERVSQAQTTFLLVDEKALPPLPKDLHRRMTEVYSTRLSRKDLVLLRFSASGGNAD